MEKGNDRNTAVSSLFVRVTPDELRNIANRMEMLANISIPGSTVSYPFSPKVTFIFEPMQSVEKFAQRVVESLEPVKSSEQLTKDNNEEARL